MNRVKPLMPNLLSTGDDDGVIKVYLVMFLYIHVADSSLSALGPSKA